MYNPSSALPAAYISEIQELYDSEIDPDLPEEELKAIFNKTYFNQEPEPRLKFCRPHLR